MWTTRPSPCREKNGNCSARWKKNGTTGGNGLIEIEGLSTSASSGKLEVKLEKKSVKKKADKAAGKEDLKKYPPVVVAKDFKDPEPPSKLFEDEKFEWDLTIGLQETLDAKGRLHNLGYLCEGGSPKDGGEKHTRRRT